VLQWPRRKPAAGFLDVPGDREGVKGEETMPSDETRRMLKVFGVAVTEFEDAVLKGAPPEKMAKAEAEVLARLQEVTALIEGLRARKK